MSQDMLDARRRATAISATYQETAAATAESIRSSVEQYNAAAKDLNARVTEALARATDVDLNGNPAAYQQWWKDYWYDYYELEKPPENGGDKPVYETSSYQPTYAFPFHSCFEKSTPVWTLTGPAPIEQIRPGDRVLSQSPWSGELAYKTVLTVTKAKPAPMIKLSIGTEAIVATRGHPFWVAGERWKMAKQLCSGTLLHSVSGAIPVDAVEEVPAAKPWYEFAYNLIVDDFHTFFVGQHKVLVHHLTLLSALEDAPSGVPGIGGLTPN